MWAGPELFISGATLNLWPKACIGCACVCGCGCHMEIPSLHSAPWALRSANAKAVLLPIVSFLWPLTCVSKSIKKLLLIMNGVCMWIHVSRVCECVRGCVYSVQWGKMRRDTRETSVYRLPASLEAWRNAALLQNILQTRTHRLTVPSCQGDVNNGSR